VRGLGGGIYGSTDAPQAASDSMRLPRRVGYITAAANFSATAYSTGTVATLRMLHCVWVPGTPLNQHRLFLQGSVVCDYSGWQTMYIVLLTMLLALSVSLLFVTRWASRERESASGVLQGAQA
jgi:hypothetical protein